MGHGSLLVIGMGYVGLPLAVSAAQAGWQVAGVEVDEGRLKQLQLGDSYVEDVTTGSLREMIDSGRLTFAFTPREAGAYDVAVITVPTPLRASSPDLSLIRDAATKLGPTLRQGVTVILESTTYPGTTEEVLAPILEELSGLTKGVDFSLGYSPERIDPGNQVWSFRTTPKIVSGIDPISLERVQSFYDSIVQRTVSVRGTREAELAKLLENTFRHVNIALVNEVAVYAADAGIDIWDSIRAAGTKPFGFMEFFPGPGVGGHCIPVDPTYLSWKVHQTRQCPLRFVELANEINGGMPQYVLNRLKAGLKRRGKTLRGARILLVGLSYKANISDVRETPAQEICERLVHEGAEIAAVEPYLHIPPPEMDLTLVPVTPAQVAQSDAVVLLTAHDSIDYGLIVRHASYILDTRNHLEGTAVERL